MTLREHRIAAGLKQKEVAATIGCHPGYLCEVEHGDRPISQHYADMLQKHYGWCIEGVRITTRRGGKSRVGKSELPNSEAEANVCLHYANRGNLLYMMGLAVRNDGVPRNWREAHRHPELARSALRVATEQLREMGVAI